MVESITNDLFSSRGINYSLLNDQKKRRPIWFLRRASLNDEMASCRIRMVSQTTKISMSHDLWYLFLIRESSVGTNWLARCLFFFFLVPFRLYSFLLSLPTPSLILPPSPMAKRIMEGYARRSRQSVLWMEPPQHSGPYCSFPTGFDHIKTWYRLILSGEEEISPITHRGILGDLSSWVQWSIFRVYISCRWELFCSALVGCSLASFNLSWNFWLWLLFLHLVQISNYHTLGPFSGGVPKYPNLHVQHNQAPACGLPPCMYIYMRRDVIDTHVLHTCDIDMIWLYLRQYQFPKHDRPRR